MESLRRILILDDESELRQMLTRYLRANDFAVQAVENSARLDHYLQRQPYDLLILDIMMKPEDGLSVCRRLRAEGQTLPILMLTARGDPLDRVLGLESGADDYLAKPFLPQELVARIRAIFRRQALERGEVSRLPQQVKFGPFRLDLARQELCRNQHPVTLNGAEMQLLVALASTLNRPVSRDNLMARARGRSYSAQDRSVDVQVLRLRKVIEQDPSAPQWLKTIWGSGYMLTGEIVA
ncbi:DNA-binding response regulator [Izhakiella australiensis]|uniref:DNA-binding dual transcriptional regulator OmpR n=2 Tax=Izhakiella australiensis TaxID=1926881 RepID=A0A1S8YM63_9GAMM|nr:DNA-binding response regulator [Izhakiella australiensis]